IDPRNMSPWFQSLIMRLFKGEPTVLGLLETNPFPDTPPNFIRITLCQYRFTDAAERERTGDWWKRTVVWVGPAISIRR
ncbi:MAG TPA: lipase maturation factor family protein, partial [Pirellulales bacterium]|nr:lipase maturation factor family protein [Pirellulales bacterium]